MFGIANNYFFRVKPLDSKKNSPKKNNGHSTSPHELSDMERVVEVLTLRAMAAGNDRDFKTAFSNMEAALCLSQNLEKKCLEAVLLNNMGLLHTLKGTWDRAMLFYDRSMELAIESCPSSNEHFLTILKKNISCLFDPKIAPPGNPKNNR